VRIVLLGMPGSGKGTQGELLARRLGVAHISSGDLLRAQITAKTELGRTASGYLERGELVPDDLVFAVVSEAVVRAAAAGGYILDGFPRNRTQAEHAYTRAVERDIAAEVVVYLELTDEAARARLTGRASLGRVDDADGAVIERRLQLYHEETQPLLDYYRERGILVTIDAAQPVAAVTEAILTALGIDASAQPLE
jgi:adenylate kinase